MSLSSLKIHHLFKRFLMHYDRAVLNLFVMQSSAIALPQLQRCSHAVITGCESHKHILGYLMEYIRFITQPLTVATRDAKWCIDMITNLKLCTNSGRIKGKIANIFIHYKWLSMHLKDCVALQITEYSWHRDTRMGTVKPIQAVTFAHLCRPTLIFLNLEFTCSQFCYWPMQSKTWNHHPRNCFSCYKLIPSVTFAFSS